MATFNRQDPSDAARPSELRKSPSLDPRPPENPGMDFERLKAEVLRWVQELSGTLWTDYNEHDPGVTIIEQLCFALTELSYRAEVPIADLLTYDHGDLDADRHALYAPRDAFPCAPVSANDYRRLLVDRLPRLGNAWLYPHEPPLGERGAAATRGLYDLYLYAPGPDPCSCEPADAPAALIDAARRIWSQHRSLCEDLRSVQLLQPRALHLQAKVIISDSQSPERVYADLLFRLARFVAPELQRKPLHALHRAGLPLTEIFTGPVLHNGCIPEDQLADKPSELCVADIVRVITEAPAVRWVHDVSLRIAGHSQALGPSDTLPIARGEILALDIDWLLQQPSPLFVLSRGQPIPCRVDVSRVRSELGKLFANARRLHPLSAQDLDALPQPNGEPRDLASYLSIQNHFPQVYGIGAAGLPSGVSNQRRAQARQLKGYLMVFEQLLVDYGAKLRGLRQLFSLDPLSPPGEPSAAGAADDHQSLLGIVPDAEEIVRGDYLSELAGRNARPQAQHQAVRQRSQALDILLALYGEQSSPAVGLPLSDPAVQSGLDLAGMHELFERKRSLLAAWPSLRAERGGGIDYLAEDADIGSSGCERLCRALLGIDIAVPLATEASDRAGILRSEHPSSTHADGARPSALRGPRAPLLSALEREGITLVSDESQASIGRPLHSLDRIIDETFDPVAAHPVLGSPSPPAVLSARQVLGNAGLVLHRDAISEGFLSAAASIENYRLGVLPGDSDVTVVCKSEGKEPFRLVGRYVDLASALAAAQQVADVMRWLGRMCYQLYLVEHALLRGAEEAPPRATTQSEPADAAGWDLAGPADFDFEYSFTVTAVVSFPPPGTRPLMPLTTGAESSLAERQAQVWDLIRENVPAHIDVVPCLLSPAQMLRFEDLQGRWKLALLQQNASELASSASKLRRFLQEHSPPRRAAPGAAGNMDPPGWSDAPTAQRR